MCKTSPFRQGLYTGCMSRTNNRFMARFTCACFICDYHFQGMVDNYAWTHFHKKALCSFSDWGTQENHCPNSLTWPSTNNPHYLQELFRLSAFSYIRKEIWHYYQCGQSVGIGFRSILHCLCGVCVKTSTCCCWPLCAWFLQANLTNIECTWAFPADGLGMTFKLQDLTFLMWRG